MMFFVYCIGVVITLDKVISQRRITNGREVTGGPKRYMAYLLRAPASPKTYDEWMCGGAIVHPLFILTSAACVEDIEYMYAITGYDKYVPVSKLEQDTCTKNTKKKIVFTCVPKIYELDHQKVEKWSYIDIAAVKVESPFVFDAPSPSHSCSWVPDQIEIIFEAKHQTPDTDVMVLGWGHKEIWRKPQDTKDYNQEKLQYTPTLILDKMICKTSYQGIPELLPVIDQYMVCTMGEGNIDADGRILTKPPGILDGCGDAIIDCTPAPNLMQFGGMNYYGFKRRKMLDANATVVDFEGPTRRNGICQNDHGGPLVTWVGGREVLIGVASVFLVNAKDRTCVGPYLHTSTQCNGAFLSCVLKMFDENKNGTTRRHMTNETQKHTNGTRRYDDQLRDRRNREDINMRYQYMVMARKGLCELPPEERGFEMIQRRISWVDHPEGPAENELNDELVERPQIPLNKLINL